MALEAGWIKTERTGERLILEAGGNWVTPALSELDTSLRTLSTSAVRQAHIDLGAVERMDTAGAWILHRTRERLHRNGIVVELAGLKPDHGAMLARISQEDFAEPAREDAGANPFVAMVERVGRAVFDGLNEGAALVNFLGATTVTAGQALRQPARIRVVALMAHMERVGLNAIPIVGLLSFLIGLVVAYQGADQLVKFGADLFVVNLLGVSIFREMGILLAAIIVAGRSGSAFAAEIGTMVVNEEVDAMRTIGLDPMEVLVLPRVLALTVAMPLLTVCADLAGILGGALMAVGTLDITPLQFIQQFKAGVALNHFWVGLMKAPVFGAIIALVGCREGLQATGSAESVGKQTTKAVVVSIFLVILFDAIFSIFFSYIGI